MKKMLIIGAALLVASCSCLAAVPTFTSISPSSLARYGTSSVTLTGTNFIAGATINVPTGFTVSGLTVVSSTQITATFALTTNLPSGWAPIGANNLSVTTSGGTSGTKVFTVIADLGAKINFETSTDYSSPAPYDASYGLIRTAITPHQGSVVTLKPGTFTVDPLLGNAFNITNPNVTISGAGAQATTIAYSPAAYTSADAFMKIQADGFILEGLSLLPQSFGLTTATNPVIDIRGTKYGKLEDVRAFSPGMGLISDVQGSTAMEGWVIRDTGSQQSCKSCGTCQFNHAYAMGVNAAAPSTSQLANYFDTIWSDARGLQGDGTAVQQGSLFAIAGTIAPFLMTHSTLLGEPLAMRPAVQIDAIGSYVPRAIHVGESYFEAGYTTDTSLSAACWKVNEVSGLTWVNDYCASSKYGFQLNGGRKITIASSILLQFFSGAITTSADALIVAGNDITNFSDAVRSSTTGASAILPAAGMSRFQIVNNRCNPHYGSVYTKNGYDSDLSVASHQGKYCVEIPSGASDYYVVTGNLAHRSASTTPETAGGISDGGSGTHKSVSGNQR